MGPDDAMKFNQNLMDLIVRQDWNGEKFNEVAGALNDALRGWIASIGHDSGKSVEEPHVFSEKLLELQRGLQSNLLQMSSRLGVQDPETIALVDTHRFKEKLRLAEKERTEQLAEKNLAPDQYKPPVRRQRTGAPDEFEHVYKPRNAGQEVIIHEEKNTRAVYDSHEEFKDTISNPEKLKPFKDALEGRGELHGGHVTTMNWAFMAQSIIDLKEFSNLPPLQQTFATLGLIQLINNEVGNIVAFTETMFSIRAASVSSAASVPAAVGKAVAAIDFGINGAMAIKAIYDLNQANTAAEKAAAGVHIAMPLINIGIVGASMASASAAFWLGPAGPALVAAGILIDHLISIAGDVKKNFKILDDIRDAVRNPDLKIENDSFYFDKNLIVNEIDFLNKKVTLGSLSIMGRAPGKQPDEQLRLSDLNLPLLNFMVSMHKEIYTKNPDGQWATSFEIDASVFKKPFILPASLSGKYHWDYQSNALNSNSFLDEFAAYVDSNCEKGAFVWWHSTAVLSDVYIKPSDLQEVKVRLNEDISLIVPSLPEQTFTGQTTPYANSKSYEKLFYRLLGNGGTTTIILPDRFERTINLHDLSHKKGQWIIKLDSREDMYKGSEKAKEALDAIIAELFKENKTADLSLDDLKRLENQAFVYVDTSKVPDAIARDKYWVHSKVNKDDVLNKFRNNSLEAVERANSFIQNRLRKLRFNGGSVTEQGINIDKQTIRFGPDVENVNLAFTLPSYQQISINLSMQEVAQPSSQGKSESTSKIRNFMPHLIFPCPKENSVSGFNELFEKLKKEEILSFFKDNFESSEIIDASAKKFAPLLFSGDQSFSQFRAWFDVKEGHWMAVDTTGKSPLYGSYYYEGLKLIEGDYTINHLADKWFLIGQVKDGDWNVRFEVSDYLFNKISIYLDGETDINALKKIPEHSWAKVFGKHPEVEIEVFKKIEGNGYGKLGSLLWNDKTNHPMKINSPFHWSIESHDFYFDGTEKDAKLIPVTLFLDDEDIDNISSRHFAKHFEQ